ncbi:ScyD/ScyE family protein [Kineococcus sp. SYSU DK004]|uniref:ScyD/ScyE family protein n=1 Tax=Kineococcus sp. SYSU DK004 TaxID=3383125 RepID=UPI003D7DED67
MSKLRARRATTPTVLSTLSAATLVLVGLAAPAHASGPPREPVEVIAEGLDDPWGLAYAKGRFYVAENGSGEVSGIIPGGNGPSVRLAGFTSLSGVDRAGDELLVLTGGAEEAGGEDTTRLFGSKRGGPFRTLANFEEYELAENPDGQLQFGEDGAPVDTLSNPFAVLAGKGGDQAYAYVTEGGGNSVLAVEEDGTVSTLYAPPVVTSGVCAEIPNNDPGVFGCDPVPTGLAHGPDGALYVALEVAGAPGEGLVVVLDAVSGEVRDTIGGFSGPTGVAVADDGTVYVAELLEGAPEGPDIPADFDLGTVGQVVRVAPDGSRSTAQVAQPLSLRWADGALYATAWSVMGLFTGQTGLGQLVRVDSSAFTAED